MNALVLSGGNIKGAYQAGAIEVVLESFEPEIITGISVGALNTAFLASYGSPVRPAAGNLLAKFWETEITSPKVLVRKRSVVELALRFLFKRWEGLISVAPLEKLVRKELGQHLPLPADEPLRASVGAVNLFSGELGYTDAREGRFLDAVMASSAEPILMPLRWISGEPFYDGGLRDITPLKHAIDQGATKIVMILCQPEHDPRYVFPTGNFLEVAEEVMGIVTNEIMANDIQVFTEINDLVKSGNAPGKRYIPLTVIRPAAPLRGDVTTFTKADIKTMLDQGRADARAALALAEAA